MQSLKNSAVVSVRPASRSVSSWPLLRAFALRWESPLWSGIFALVLYGIMAYLLNGRFFWQATPFAYFNYLADAFLHGQLHFRVLPPTTHDLSLFQGRYYAYWGPLPAVLLLPFVAIFGVQFSDVIPTFMIGAANVALMALLLRHAAVRGVARTTRLRRGLLVLFFALGTVHMTLAPNGRVWFTGQLLGFLCVTLTYLAALRGRGWPAFALAGLAIAAALLTRNHLILAGLWPACYLLYRHRAAPWRRLAGYTLLGLTPVVAAAGLIAAYNYLRFGSFGDNGLDYHLMAQVFQADYQRYGAFHLHYLPTNLYYQYIAYPFPLRPETPMGGSLFLLSPIFFAVFWGVRNGRRNWSTWALLGTVLLVATPILLLMGTGYVQFGPRYTLDFYCPLLLLTAMGVRRWPLVLMSVFTIISVVHYVIGAVLLH